MSVQDRIIKIDRIHSKARECLCCARKDNSPYLRLYELKLGRELPAGEHTTTVCICERCIERLGELIWKIDTSECNTAIYKKTENETMPIACDCCYEYMTDNCILPTYIHGCDVVFDEEYKNKRHEYCPLEVL